MGWLPNPTLLVVSMKVDWIARRKCNLKWLSWCFFVVLGDSQSSRWWGNGMALRRKFGHYNWENWLSMWMIERFKCDLTNTHQNDLTMRWLKLIRHTCATWLISTASDNNDTHDWSLIDRNDTYATVYLTPCVITMDAFIVNTTSAHEAKALSITRTMVASMNLTSTCKTC